MVASTTPQCASPQPKSRTFGREPPILRPTPQRALLNSAETSVQERVVGSPETSTLSSTPTYCPECWKTDHMVFALVGSLVAHIAARRSNHRKSCCQPCCLAQLFALSDLANETEFPTFFFPNGWDAFTWFFTAGQGWPCTEATLSTLISRHFAKAPCMYDLRLQEARPDLARSSGSSCLVCHFLQRLKDFTDIIGASSNNLARTKSVCATALRFYLHSMSTYEIAHIALQPVLRFLFCRVEYGLRALRHHNLDM